MASGKHGAVHIDLHGRGCPRGLRNGLYRHRQDGERVWCQGGVDARAVLDGQAEVQRRALREVIASAERLMAGADTVAASPATTVRAAAAHVATAASSLDALWRDVLARVGDHLTAAQAEITGRAGEIAGTDMPTLLSRGYAIVTDTSGQIIRKPAEACAAGRVTLILAGGSVLASIEQGLQPLTPGDHA